MHLSAPAVHDTLFEMLQPASVPLLNLNNASFWGHADSGGSLELEDNPGVCTHAMRVRAAPSPSKAAARCWTTTPIARPLSALGMCGRACMQPKSSSLARSTCKKMRSRPPQDLFSGDATILTTGWLSDTARLSNSMWSEDTVTGYIALGALCNSALAAGVTVGCTRCCI